MALASSYTRVYTTHDRQSGSANPETSRAHPASVREACGRTLEHDRALGARREAITEPMSNLLRVMGQVDATVERIKRMQREARAYAEKHGTPLDPFWATPKKGGRKG
jgi:hypothetical protein